MTAFQRVENSLILEHMPHDRKSEILVAESELIELEMKKRKLQLQLELKLLEEKLGK